MERSVLSDFKTILTYCSYFFKKKSEFKEEITSEYSEKLNLTETYINKLLTINQDIERGKEKLMTKVFISYYSLLNCLTIRKEI